MIVNRNRERILNWIVLALYVAAIGLVTAFHEPWFDEAQAYLIARDAAIYDIIFSIPHFEGHPFLWHLYLVPFARSPLPFEVGLKLAAIIVNTAAMGLFIFKAPFKKLFRYTLPFSYYFFFLYGVVARAYSFAMLGFVLAAITYKNRHEKPWAYMFSLMLLALSCAYGIVFAAGLALVWVADIIKEMRPAAVLKNMFTDKRLLSLWVLLAFALSLIYLIVPYENTIGIYYSKVQSFASRLFYMAVLAPGEAVFMHYFSGNYHVSHLRIPPDIMISGIGLFLMLAFVLGLVAKSKSKLKELIVPYVMFAFFSALMYFTEHHVSNMAYFLMFVLWICFDEKSSITVPKWAVKGEKNPVAAQERFINLLKGCALVCVAVSLYWTGSVVYKDVKWSYDSKRHIAEFIKEHDMEDALIMSKYGTLIENDGTEHMCLNVQAHATVNAYFNSNIITSLNDGKEGYIHHFLPDDEYISATLEKWRSLGSPDVIIGNFDLEAVYLGTVDYDEYTPVLVSYQNRFTKDDTYTPGRKVVVYLRNDLLEEYNLSAVKDG